MIVKIVFGVITLLFGIYYLYIIIKKHKAIDSSSSAEVTSVKDLGWKDGRKAYALYYTIEGESPLELVISPKKRPKKIGYTRTLYYAEDNFKKNYYFKTIGSFDSRFVFPIIILVSSLYLIISQIISFWG